ncbi:MAG: hybrid sensor histidine kinase/response regulator [marine bacterium B5-7]|nr:MAG: hybrid sensor histidine kinase/response regulator [marine bacterium B5-7]
MEKLKAPAPDGGALFEQIFNNTQDLVVAVNANAEIVHVNPAAAAYLGWSATELSHQNFIHLCLRQGIAVPRSDVFVEGLSAVNQPMLDAIKNVQTVHADKIDWQVCRCGEMIVLQGRCSPPSAIFSADQFLRKLSQSVIGNLFWKDIDGRYLGFYGDALTLLGMKQEDVIGRTDSDVFGEQGALLHEHDLQVIKADRPIHFDEMLNFPRRPQHRYTVMKAPYKNALGETIGVIGHAMDVTESLMQRQALDNMRRVADKSKQAKSEFMACVSHDLRTPLNGIIGMAEVLKQDATLSTSQHTMLTDLLCAGEQLSSAIDSILLLSKLEEDGCALSVAPTDLSEVLRQLSEQFRRRALNAGLQFTTKIDPIFEKGLLTIDADKLRLVLRHLLDNAIKFTQAGNIGLRVTCLNKVEEEITLQIAVSDTGAGIEKSRIPEIFERFNRGYSSYEGKHEGLGLGLTIVKHLVEKMKGDVRAVSEPGEGSTFVFTLTLPWEDKKETKGSAMVDLLANASKCAITHVLLVEDNVINQRVVVNMLKPLNCSVDIAPDAKTALELFNTDYDLVLMDIGLPDMSGYALTKEIKSQYDPENKVPVFALTAHVADSDTKEVLAAGMQAHLKKPIKSEVLRQVLDEVKHHAAVG